MRSSLFTAATALMLLAHLQLSESSRASDRLTEQLKILADIRHMPKGTADAEGFISYERSYARTNRHTGSHTSLEYKVSSLVTLPSPQPCSARTKHSCSPRASRRARSIPRAYEAVIENTATRR